MPLKTDLKCVQCGNKESLLWRNVDNGVICYICYEDNKMNLKNELEPDNSDQSNINNVEEKKIRKSTRSTRYKLKSLSVHTSAIKIISKGKSRRNIFKKNIPARSPTVAATTSYVDNTFYNGSYIQIGDIVSLADNKENVYYAQIRGLLVDSYCEKSAFLTWLVPTKASPPPNERFDPSTYIIGPEEDFLRKLNCLRFVMHAPSNYYHNKSTPYPIPDVEDTVHNYGFIWTRLEKH